VSGALDVDGGVEGVRWCVRDGFEGGTYIGGDGWMLRTVRTGEKAWKRGMYVASESQSGSNRPDA